MQKKNIGVVLMTYGSPTSLHDIPQYLTHIRKGKPPDDELVREFKRRYTLIGGSPLIQITQSQAHALETLLNKENLRKQFLVQAAMRFSPPFIEGVIDDLSKKVDCLIGIIMSPQYSPIIMQGYRDEFSLAVAKHPLPYAISQAWYTNPNFIHALAKQVINARAKIAHVKQTQLLLLFSAHSMPRRVVEHESEYIQSLHKTAKLVAQSVGLSSKEWMFCYQSAGHTPEEWLKPDFSDIMPKIRKQKKTHVLIAPIQFLADHLEILYDIEIAAREQAESQGITFLRTQSLNISPLFIEALRDVTLDTLKSIIEYVHIL